MAYYGTPSGLNIGLISIPTSDGASTSFQIPSTSLRYLLLAAFIRSLSLGHSLTILKVRWIESIKDPNHAPPKSRYLTALS